MLKQSDWSIAWRAQSALFSRILSRIHIGPKRVASLGMPVSASCFQHPREAEGPPRWATAAAQRGLFSSRGTFVTQFPERAPSDSGDNADPRRAACRISLLTTAAAG
jgi:hypothetical protein